MIVADQDVIVAVSIQVPLIDGLDVAGPRDIQVCARISKRSVPEIVKSGLNHALIARRTKKGGTDDEGK